TGENHAFNFRISNVDVAKYFTLMEHSMRNDVDLMHYNCQSEEDLKRVYDKVMSNVEISMNIVF
ncbi:unnamed protein product, partial [marine sediment metagenome]